MNYKKYGDKYHQMILNTMFSKLQITRLMKTLLGVGFFNAKLHYVERMNYLFLEETKDDKSNYKDASGANYFKQDFYSILKRESKIIYETKYNYKDYRSTYEDAIKICLEHKIDFYDDTDRFENEDIKKKYNLLKKGEIIQDFKSIEEILEFLDHYTPAFYTTPEVDYIIEKNSITHFPGYLKHDERVFKIMDFLLENKYIDDKYYLKEEFIPKDADIIDSLDIDTLDYAHLSYFIVMIFRRERFFEGIVDTAVRGGSMKKLVERAKQLKEK